MDKPIQPDEEQLRASLARLEALAAGLPPGAQAAIQAELHALTGEIQQVDCRLRHAEQETARARQEMQEFVSIASHELQEPLRKVRAFGGLLHQRCGAQLDDEGGQHLQRMLSAGQRMQAMLDGLLAYSRVTTQGGAFVAVDLTQLAQKALSGLEYQYQQCGGQVRIDPLGTIQADPAQMRQVFFELLENALKFQRPGVRPEVHLWAAAEGSSEQTCLCVQDNGLGFEARHAESIFRPFTRLMPKEQYPGCGMGLAVCARIVERHAGRIHACSTPGAGSTFFVILPLSQDCEPAHP